MRAEGEKARPHLGLTWSSSFGELWTAESKPQPIAMARVVVDPSNGIQTIKPSSVCLTSCTAPIQHHQTIYSCVTATSVDCLSLESPEMFEHSKISEKIQAKGRVSPRGHHCHTTSRVRGEFCESKHCFISKICIVYPQSAGYLMLTVQFHDNWATRRLMIASHF